MKVTYSVVLLLVALAATHGYPATKSDEKETVDKEVDFVPLEGRRPEAVFPPDGVVDVDAGGFFGNPFVGNPFPSLLGSIEGLMARMRQQLSQILGRLPEKPGDSPFPELHIPNLGDVDLGKGNTTSVTKVIDGHKVTINETEYKQDGENGAAFFKVRIIDVHPDSEEASTEKDAEPVAPANRDRESVEDTFNNEIPKTKDNEELTFDNLETFDEVDIVPPHKYANMHKNVNWNNLHSLESIEDNNIDAAPQPIRDLSNDIYVNQLMADAGAPTNPDAEVFDVIDGHVSSQYYPAIKPERISVLNYVQPQMEVMKVPTNFPTSDFVQPQAEIMKVPTNFPTSNFERVVLQQEPMHLYSGMPLYIPPTFSINNQKYSLPVEHMLPQPNNQFIPIPYSPTNNNQFADEQILIQPSLPVMTKQQNYVPTEKNENEQVATTNKIVVQTSIEADDQNRSSATQTNVVNTQQNDKSSDTTIKQSVSTTFEEQAKSSKSNVQEVPEKHLPSTSEQAPSAST